MRLFGFERVNQEVGEGKVWLRSVGTWLGGLLVVGLVLVGAGSVAAQSTTIINGCYDQKTGVLRYLQSGSCLNKENPISWNQVGPQGPQGPQGVKGDTGPQGPQGPSGVSGYTEESKAIKLPPQTLDEVDVLCPTGTKVLGGGVKSFNFIDDNGGDVSQGIDRPIEIKESFPNGTGTYSAVVFNHDFFTAYYIRVYATCADVTP